jgi:Protein of unknown function (DUF3306)
MANDETPAGFLSRWSRRKIDVREGRTLDEPKSSTPNPAPSTDTAATLRAGITSVQHADNQAVQPPPTLADAQQLTPESDFTGFMARGVAPDVKNAAMKKLFTDPHFNVMDRLDIYIDDYSQPDPLPLAMLRQMTCAKTLNLFDDEPQEAQESLDIDVESVPEASPIDAAVHPAAQDSGTKDPEAV